MNKSQLSESRETFFLPIRYFIYGTLVMKGQSCMKVEHKMNVTAKLLKAFLQCERGELKWLEGK
jgi:hypothetical protein